MSTSESNEAVVRACFENASQGNFDALDDIVAEDYVLHPEEVGRRGRAQGDGRRATATPSAAFA